MFSAHCEGCGAEVLLTTRRIVRLDNTRHGILVVFRCWQGHLGTWLTGRAAEGGHAPREATGREAARPGAMVGS